MSPSLPGKQKSASSTKTHTVSVKRPYRQSFYRRFRMKCTRFWSRCKSYCSDCLSFCRGCCGTNEEKSEGNDFSISKASLMKSVVGSMF